MYYSFLQGLHWLAEKGGPEECFLTRHQPDLSCMTLWLADSSFTSTSKINLSFIQMQKLHGGCFISKPFLGQLIPLVAWEGCQPLL